MKASHACGDRLKLDNTTLMNKQRESQNNEPVGISIPGNYLRRGYPIASGVIEGACRHFVKDRMESSGMRWTLEGARSMLNVRAAFQGDHWREFVDWNMAAQVDRTHPNRHLLRDYTAPAIAC